MTDFVGIVINLRKAKSKLLLALTHAQNLTERGELDEKQHAILLKIVEEIEKLTEEIQNDLAG